MKKKLLAIIMALVMGVSVGALASCDIVTTDSEKDMAQTVAEVDISKSEDFAEDGAFYAYKDVIRPMSVSKRNSSPTSSIPAIRIFRRVTPIPRPSTCSSTVW